jgi:hypothetical protein
MTLEKYEDLVFSPLALPPPPAVDSARLVTWLTWAREQSLRRGGNVPEAVYESAAQRRLPWLMATIHYHETPAAVEESFEREFPEIAAYVRLFPIKRLKLIALNAHRGDEEVHLHTDSDGFWGIRFYLANRKSDRMYFCMARDRSVRLPPGLADDWSKFVDLRRHYVRFPDDNRPFCLNSMRAAHCVEAAPRRLGERIICLVLPQRDGLDRERMLQLLDRSSWEFAHHQLWYRAPESAAREACETAAA